VAEPDSGSPSTTGFGETVIRSAGGRVYLSENGGEFRQLPFGDTAETRQLLELLQASGPASAGLKLRPVILAGDGGAGFHWSPIRDQPAPPKRGAPTRTRGEVPAEQPPIPTNSPAAAGRAAKG
jgi:hypothetical protein